MNKNMLYKILFPVLVIIAVLVWKNALGGPRTKTAPSFAPAGPEEAKWLEVIAESRQNEGPLTSWFKDWGRNPFYLKKVPLGEPSQIAVSLSLSGIFWDDQKTTAVINGKVVQEGDIIEFYYVVSIERDKVILNNGSADFELTLE